MKKAIYQVLACLVIMSVAHAQDTQQLPTLTKERFTYYEVPVTGGGEIGTVKCLTEINSSPLRYELDKTQSSFVLIRVLDKANIPDCLNVGAAVEKCGFKVIIPHGAVKAANSAADFWSSRSIVDIEQKWVKFLIGGISSDPTEYYFSVDAEEFFPSMKAAWEKLFRKYWKAGQRKKM